MKTFLKIKQTNDWRYEVHTLNGKFFGTFETLDDGFFYYCFPNVLNPGVVPFHILGELAMKLEEVNEPWNEIIKQDHEKWKKTTTYPMPILDSDPFK